MSHKIKPGTVPANRIPVIDRHGHIRGNVTTKATAATASRFTNNPNMKLTDHNGRQCWVEQD